MPDSSMAAKRIIPPDEPSRDIANATAEMQRKSGNVNLQVFTNETKNELFIVREEIEGQRVEKGNGRI